MSAGAEVDRSRSRVSSSLLNKTLRLVVVTRLNASSSESSSSSKMFPINFRSIIVLMVEEIWNYSGGRMWMLGVGRGDKGWNILMRIFLLMLRGLC